MTRDKIDYSLCYFGWTDYSKSLPEMLFDLPGLQAYSSFFPPYEVINSVLESGKDFWDNHQAKWKPFSISKDEYYSVSSLIIKRQGVNFGRSVPGIDTLEQWHAYVYYRYTDLPMEQYLRLTLGVELLSQKIDALEEEKELNGTDVSSDLDFFNREKSALLTEEAAIFKKYPLLPKEARNAIDEEYLIDHNIK